MKLKHLGSMLIIIALTAFLPSCDKDETRPKESTQILSAAKVSVDKVIKRIAANQLEVVGTVQAVQRAEISSNKIIE